MSCIHNPDIQSLQFPFLIGIFLGLGIPSDDVFVNQKAKRSGEPCVSSPPSWGDICRIILGFGLYIKNAERCNDKITILVDRTTTMVAYQLATTRSADLIAVVKNGVIAEKGKHET